MTIDQRQRKLLSRRVLMLGGGQAVLLSALIGRLYQLQIVEADRYALLAEQNRINIYPLLPTRGQIVDRFGAVLATDRPTYSLVLRREAIADARATLRALAALIKLNPADIEPIIARMSRHRPFVPVEVKSDLPWDEVAKIAVNAPDLPGVSIETGRRRFYPAQSAAAHVIGYVGQGGPLDERGDSAAGAPLGVIGLEKALDVSLRGTNGLQYMEVNASGRPVRELSRQRPTRGRDVKTTLALDLQKFAADRLSAERQAAAVVLAAATGEILSLVSTPSFDPNRFSERLSPQGWKSLMGDPDLPLLNRAIGGEYAPGSTFKMTVALAALEFGAVDPQHTVFCPGYFQLGDSVFHCWKRQGHGRVAMVQAIAQSCDVYFYDIALRVGVDRIAEMALRLGFGQTFGLGRGERSGIVPTEAWKRTVLRGAWHKGETVIAGIGQGYLTATPLQLAVMTARIVNGGYAVRPQLQLTAADDTRPSASGSADRVAISRRWLDLMREAMAKVVNSPTGTAYGARIAENGFQMGGKTGTSQVRRITAVERRAGPSARDAIPWRERDHALFVGWAPLDVPAYVVAVVVPHGGSGSKAAAPIARDILIQAQRRRIVHGLSPSI